MLIRRMSPNFAALCPQPSGGGGGAVVWTPTANPVAQAVANNSASATFSGVAIGTAAADRVVIVDVGCVNGASNTLTCTINGTTATLAAVSGVAARKAALFYLPLTTGTTATIVVTSSAAFSMQDIQINVGALNTSTPTPTMTDADNFAFTAQGTTLTVPTNGIGLIAVHADPLTTQTGMTTDYATTISGTTNNYLGHTTATGSVVIALDNGGNGIAAAYAAWGP